MAKGGSKGVGRGSSPSSKANLKNAKKDSLKKDYGNSKLTVYGEVYNFDDKKNGNEDKYNSLLKLAGVPGNIKARIFIEKDINNSDNDIVTFLGTEITLRRKINVLNKEIENVKMKVSKNDNYSGTDLLKMQVKEASKQGYKTIKTEAFRDEDGEYNGYYTWARLGYIPKKQPSKQIEDFNKKYGTNAKTLQDLMATKEGRDFWKKNGETFNGEFDLSPNSYSMNTLKNYKKGG